MKPKMIHKKISQLKPYEKNPRNNEAAVEAVAESIKQNGFVQPIVIDQKNRICIGHTRFLAAQLLELQEVPVIVKEMTEADFMRLNIADNKTGELADWDDDLLKEMILDLDAIGDDLEIPGLDIEEIDSMIFSEVDAHEEARIKKEKEELNQSNKSVASKDSSGPQSKMVFFMTAKQMIEVDAKLGAIRKEHNLDTDSDALLFALKDFKGNPKVKRVTKE